MRNWRVVVGNIGTVYYGTDEGLARRMFTEYRSQSEGGCGRVSGELVVLMCDGEPIEETGIDTVFPEDTATVIDPAGFPHVGHLTDQRDEENGTALYYFPGDFIAGDGTEAWLDPFTAGDAESLADYLSCDGAEWTGGGGDNA